MDRTERLVNLLVALLDTKRPLTREELRQRVGGYSEDKDAFHRNFERDKDLLRQMGIPVVAEPLDNTSSDEPATGYRVPRDLYELPDPGLDEDELVALNLAVSAVALDGSARGAATTALWKLAAASGRAASSALAIGGPGRSGANGNGRPRRPPLADVPADEKVAALFAAVAERRVCRFDYNGVSRRIDPWRLSYRQGRWYLAGFDHGREAERLFRVDRVVGNVHVEEAAGTFERPQGAVAGPPPAWRLGDDEEVVVDLMVDASHVPWVMAMTGEPALPGPGTRSCVRVRVTNREAFRSFVLGLLDHVEVVAPPDVRHEVVAWLSALARPA